MRNEKILEKLATQDMQDVSELFSLADKCASAAEGRAWNSQPALEAGKVGKPDADAAAQSSGKNKKKKKMAPHGEKWPRQPSGSNEDGPWCPVHNSRCHNMEECREIKKLMEQFRVEQKQQVAPEGNKEGEMECQDTIRAVKAVYSYSNSNSSTDERRKKLYIMHYGDITSKHVVKTLRRAVAVATPAQRAVPHHKWMEKLIRFNASYCPKNMAGAG
jgi:hypothetical protein